jgi:hypothetical protein
MEASLQRPARQQQRSHTSRSRQPISSARSWYNLQVERTARPDHRSTLDSLTVATQPNSNSLATTAKSTRPPKPARQQHGRSRQLQHERLRDTTQQDGLKDETSPRPSPPNTRRRPTRAGRARHGCNTQQHDALDGTKVTGAGNSPPTTRVRPISPPLCDSRSVCQARGTDTDRP